MDGDRSSGTTGPRRVRLVVVLEPGATLDVSIAGSAAAGLATARSQGAVVLDLRPDGGRILSQIQDSERHSRLSPQENRVLAQVALGRTNKEIARELNLSDKTVKNYLSNAFQKLQVGRRSHAAALFRSRKEPG